MKRPERVHASRDQPRIALLLIDVINDLNFPEAEGLMRTAPRMAKALRLLQERCRVKGIPSIYVNDNFGRWRSDFRAVVAHCTAEDSRGRQIARQLLPKADDYFVLKPLHSGFYCTTLDVLLTHLRVETLILAGIAADICVLFTANDAYMRGFRLFIPRDCVISNSPQTTRRALVQMSNLLKADTRPSTRLRLRAQLAE
jgi:nicotinamidase-related amidase